ncbi:MAG: glycerate kinase [Solirubrobacteraceae bacterium]
MEAHTRPLLIVSEDFSESLPAAAVAKSIARGLTAGGLPEADLCPVPDVQPGEDIRATLDSLDFDSRMRAAGAVVVAARQLRESTLDGSAAFEIATRARQAGVPAFAVTAESRLDAFDARILDLQAIIEARDTRSLTAAGRRLAGLGVSLPQL